MFVTVSENGQVVIPAKFRARQDISAGGRLEVTEYVSSQYRAGLDFSDALEGVHGCSAILSYNGKFRKRAGRAGLHPPVLAP